MWYEHDLHLQHYWLIEIYYLYDVIHWHLRFLLTLMLHAQADFSDI